MSIRTGGSAFRRIVGIALLVIGVLRVIFALAGIIIGSQAMNGIGVAVKDTLALTTDGVNTTKGALEQTKSTLQLVQSNLGDVETAIADTGEAIVQAQPLLDQALTIISTDVPDSFDAVNAALPGAARMGHLLAPHRGAVGFRGGGVPGGGDRPQGRR